MADYSASSTDPGAAGIEVPWTRVEGLVAKLTHDVRNGFNALELQVTLIGELSDDPEIKEEVKRVRQSLAGLTRQLQAIRVATGAPTPHLFPYPVADFLEDLRDRFKKQHGDVAARVDWPADAGEASANIDPEQTMHAILELLDNALQHAADGFPLRLEVRPGAGAVILSIHQRLSAPPASPPQNWGRTPLLSSRRNVYGLGAFRARRILKSQGGALDYVHSETDGSLVTTITLPVAESLSSP